MRLHIGKSGTTFLAACLMSSQAFALTINDAGVVGTVEAGTQNASVGNVTDWANYLLGLAINTAVTADGNTPTDGVTENYETGNNDYSGTLTGGTRVDGATPSIVAFEWVMGKYDGQDAGYVLFNVADYRAANGYTTTIPEFSYSIWGAAGQYQLSNITGFGVPEPTTLLLLGVGLAGVGFTSWKKKREVTRAA